MAWASVTNFAGAKGTSLSTLGFTNIDLIANDIVTDGSGRAQGSFSGYSNDHLVGFTGTGTATGVDQISRVTLFTDDVDKIGAAVRVDNSVGDAYVFYSQANSQTLVAWNGATPTGIGSSSVAVTAGDIIEIRAIGDQISGYINGALVVGPVTNEVATTVGQGAGMLLDDDVGDYDTPATLISAWSGGDAADDPGIGGGSSVVALMMAHHE